MEKSPKKQFYESVIILTRDCNFKCKHCYVKQSAHYLNPKKIKNIIKVLKKNKIKKITLIGGEPLLYPHLKEVLESLPDFDVNITTNGSNIPNFLLKTKIKNIKIISVSLHYMTQSKFFDFTDNTRISLKNILKNIIILKDIYQIRINSTILPNNQEDIKKIIDFAKKNKLNGVHLSPLFSSKKAKQNFELKEIITSKKSFNEFSDKTATCSINKKIVIDTNGQIFGCTVLIDQKELAISSIDNYSIQEHIKLANNQKYICLNMCN